MRRPTIPRYASSPRWRLARSVTVRSRLRSRAGLLPAAPTITPQSLKTFSRQARKRMRTESGGYRRDYLRALAQRVEVDTQELRIMGSKSELLRTLVAASSAKTAGFGVPSSVPKCRAGGDSNRYARARAGQRRLRPTAARSRGPCTCRRQTRRSRLEKEASSPNAAAALAATARSRAQACFSAACGGTAPARTHRRSSAAWPRCSRGPGARHRPVRRAARMRSERRSRPER
jgi:hypothetical protein